MLRARRFLDNVVAQALLEKAMANPKAAAAALQELRRAQPNISLAWIADEMPIMHAMNWSAIWRPSAAPA